MKKYIGALIYDDFPRAKNSFSLEIISAKNRRQAEGKLAKLSEDLAKGGKRIVSKQLAYLGNEIDTVKELNFKRIYHQLKI